ncbi:MAG: 3-deoxy-8-phosphooctulonate synthase [Candidatus Omnitrophica bacterium]|nr:3-deoxy-8-phosphooctulonate synthase [Candidatus Omnitrophota bacterium]
MPVKSPSCAKQDTQPRVLSPERSGGLLSEALAKERVGVRPVALEGTNVIFGSSAPFVLIAGPCVIEGEAAALRHAEKIAAIAGSLKIPYVFKASYDKANRSSGTSFRGPGLQKGIRILAKIKKEIGVPVLSDVHCRAEVGEAAEVLDILQIPAFLCRQTDLILEAAKTGKAVNIKKGQFMAPWDMGNAVEKIVSAGNQKVLLTERGISFGYNNLVSDFRAIPIMRRFGYPVIFDATHSVQLPGGLGNASGGQREFIPTLAKCAVVSLADGLFFEVHENPGKALSDGPNAVALKDLKALLELLKDLKAVL